MNSPAEYRHPALFSEKRSSFLDDSPTENSLVELASFPCRRLFTRVVLSERGVDRSPRRHSFLGNCSCVTLPPASLQSCVKAEFGQISRSFSLNSGAIRLKRPKNLTQIGFPSLRSVKSDRLLAVQVLENSIFNAINPSMDKQLCPFFPGILYDSCITNVNYLCFDV